MSDSQWFSRVQRDVALTGWRVDQALGRRQDRRHDHQIRVRQACTSHGGGSASRGCGCGVAAVGVDALHNRAGQVPERREEAGRGRGRGRDGLQLLPHDPLPSTVNQPAQCSPIRTHLQTKKIQSLSTFLNLIQTQCIDYALFPFLVTRSC